jgi:hypothetical protein
MNVILRGNDLELGYQKELIMMLLRGGLSENGPDWDTFGKYSTKLNSPFAVKPNRARRMDCPPLKSASWIIIFSEIALSISSGMLQGSYVDVCSE